MFRRSGYLVLLFIRKAHCHSSRLGPHWRPRGSLNVHNELTAVCRSRRTEELTADCNAGNRRFGKQSSGHRKDELVGEQWLSRSDELTLAKAIPGHTPWKGRIGDRHEQQAAEGFSIEGQADKLRSYAQLHDLGEVVVIADPGKSGKDLNRPGLQQLLAMVDAGHVANVLLWRLDRLSRNLGDLIDLADQCGQHGAALHSFTERLDLSSATGRMFYNIIGTFAQFYREQLGENVRMGMHQGALEGKGA